MYANIKIMQGKKLLFSGRLVPQLKTYEFKVGAEDSFSEVVFNIERYINEQGAYRCHTEIKTDDEK